jgi:hypothetical protein
MPRQWFYAHNGHTHGPVSARKLKYLAATGGLQPQDLIWPEDDEPEKAVVAEVALDFAALRRLAQAARQRGGAGKPRAEGDPSTEWRDEIDQLFRDPEQAVGPVPDWLQSDPPADAASAASGLPDWLDEPPAEAPAEVAPESDAPAAEPAPPVGGSLLERMGIDPVSERVVDWGKLRAWLDGQRQQPTAATGGGPEGQEDCSPGLTVPSESDPDPFHTARKELAAWFDREKNRERLARGDATAIRHDATLQLFMSHFERYGRDKLARLWEYVEFLIETRARRA